MKITRVVFGKTVLPRSMVFSGGDESSYMPIVLSVFLIECGEKRILVDAGCVTMPGYDVTDFVGPACALAQIGTDVNDITDLILTHSHHDHTECASIYKNATVYIERSEYEDAARFISPDSRLVLFDEGYEVAEGVRIVRVGGHTKGSSVVEVDTGDKICVLVGDECYSRECIEKGIPTGVSVCKDASVEFIKKYSSDKYCVLVTHDI